MRLGSTRPGRRGEQIASFSTGAFVPQDGLDAAVRGMLDQVLTWSGALRGSA